MPHEAATPGCRTGGHGSARCRGLEAPNVLSQQLVLEVKRSKSAQCYCHAVPIVLKRSFGISQPTRFFFQERLEAISGHRRRRIPVRRIPYQLAEKDHRIC